MSTQPQFIITAPDGTELLLSFWGGIDEDPECAPRLDDTRWGIPLPVRRIDVQPQPVAERRPVDLDDAYRSATGHERGRWGG
jgi:hypothetical protein